MPHDPILKNNVKVSGNTDAKQTIVFGNGFGTDTSAWKHVIPAFGGDYRIITYDNVGGGKSDPSAFVQSRYMHLQSYAIDLVEIGKALHLKDVIFVGHSVSGMIGLLASKRSPELFSKIIFMNASPRYLNDGDYVGGFEKQDLMELYRLMASNYYAWARGFAANVMGNADKPQLADEFARTLSEVRADIALVVAKAIFESDHRADLKGFTLPSLILQSTKDIAVPLAVGNYLNQHLSGSILRVIQAEGHFPHLSAPSEVIQELKAFLANSTV